MTEAPKAAPTLPRGGSRLLGGKDSILAINKSVTSGLLSPVPSGYSKRQGKIGRAAVAEILKTGEALARALALLEAGEVVAIPTETVYGLAGDATNGAAVARIFEAKGRPRFNPLIAHVSGIVMASEIAVFDALSEKLAMTMPETCAISGLKRGRPFASKMRATAAPLVASPARP